MLLFTRALLVAGVLSGAACSVYDSLPPYSNSNLDSSVGPDGCSSHTETCNGKDDDCDGKVDEAAAVQLDCESKIKNSSSLCESGYCIRTGECNPGFFNCDGMPDNGCESSCPCGGCDQDAGPDGS
jgi:hypothetical protein